MLNDDRKGFVRFETGSEDDANKRSPVVSVQPTSSFDKDIETKTSKFTPTPLDTGKAAYTVLLSCFLLQSGVSGFPLAFGVFEEYYSTKFNDFETASWIGVLGEGLPYLGAPLMTICCQKFHMPRQLYIIAGICLCVLSLGASAFMNGLSGLIITQGCMFGLGSLLIEIPSLTILDTHFEKRQGLAYGIVFGGADLAGVGYAFLATYLFESHSYQTTMTVFTSLTLVIAACAVVFLRERVVAPAQSSVGMGINRSETFVPKPLVRAKSLIQPTTILRGASSRHKLWSAGHRPQDRYHRRAVFYIFNISNIVLAIASELPWIYLPTFATELGYGRGAGALIIAVGNLSQVFGEIGFGKLSDKVNVSFLIIITMAVSSLSTFFLWGVLGSTSLGVLLAYACVFGCFSAGYLALWARIGSLFGETDSTMVYSILSTGKGAGGILSGPISQILLTKSSSIPLGNRSNSRWGAIIAYVTSCTAASALMGVFTIIATAREQR